MASKDLSMSCATFPSRISPDSRHTSFKPLKSRFRCLQSPDIAHFRLIRCNSISSCIPFPLKHTKPLVCCRLNQRHVGFVVKASAQVGAAATPQITQPRRWKGAALKPLAASIATGVILWFTPVPSSVSRKAWQLLAIFMATIVGIITQPLPLGAVAIMGLSATVLTKTLTYEAAFSGFCDQIPWLLAMAFFFSKGFTKTGLGTRLAYHIVSLFGSSSLGLGYSLVFSEALLAPAIPSVSARAGGIFLPLVKSLSTACGSNVGDGTERKLGSWLVLTCFQTSVISSSMFLTAMAANPLCATLTYSAIQQSIGWIDWAKAGVVPGLVSLFLVPMILYWIYPPTLKSSPGAPKVARENLEKMGAMTVDEKIMATTLVFTVRHTHTCVSVYVN